MSEQGSESMSEIAEKIFLGALEYASVPERDAYVQNTCDGNVSLRNTVQTMLEDHLKATRFFHETAKHLSLPIEVQADEELESGTVIGPYHIVKILGEGGCGRVYEAEQETPVSRRVALKILKLGMDTKAVISRFEAERQALAIMEHPNISRVFDAGSTASGRPYFVMELVHGTKITDYCESHNLPLEERLRLMCQVCAAVQHAHNKGIIHRDIKPSNILVTVVDGIAVPKVIDFGIAKATDRLTDAGESRTIQGQPIGTPAYMSPEQFGGGTRDIDTRSDVYSLGVVLYELLAGQPPFDNDELLEKGFDEMRRRILYEVPRRPSLLRVQREAMLRGELDWIVMKALEKDRENRYSTAHSFATDIESYLRNEPIKAHPPSRIYRFKKLLRRNRLTSASIAVAALALTIGFTLSSILYLRAHSAEMEQTRLREAAEERAHVTKAAILIMQDKIEEADAEIKRMGGSLSQPSVEASNVFRTLAIWSAKKGDWKTSADRWLAMSNVNRFDDNDMTDKVTHDLLPIAPTLVMTNDFKRYHEFQNFLINRLGQTTNLFAAEHLLKLCLLTPASPSLLSRLHHAATMAEQSLRDREPLTPKDWMEAWRCVAIGLWYYRNGQPDKAIPWCNRSLLRHDWEEARNIQTLLIRAMARKLTGDIDGAVSDLDIARISVRQHLQQPLDQMKDGYFHDWLNALILMNEAERVVLEAR